MNKRLLALFLLSSVAALAQSSSASDEPPPAEMPSNLTFETDIYFIEPKFTLSFGTRGLSGTKSSFQGTGHLASVSDTLGAVGTLRTYHDGTVGVDQRATVIDNGDGTATSLPIAPDGYTNTWSFTNQSQVVGDNIALHTYTADVIDTGPKNRDPGSTYGVEVAVARDMGKFLRFNWAVGGGLSINDINSKLTSLESARVTTNTDLYGLNGQAAPTAPYNSPSSVTETVTNDDGTTTSVTTDTSTLLNQNHTPTTSSQAVDSTHVTNHFKLKGAYYTMRAGPTLTFPITQRFRASLSAGAALVYAGTTYSVQQDFQPDTGALITATDQKSESAWLPGYYVDANLEYWLTGNAGLYVGGTYQNNGDFSQDLKTTTANYSTRVDLSSLQGFRMGMNLKF